MKFKFYKFALLIGCVALYGALTSAKAKPKYKDSRYSIEERVKDLISRMTLEEKAAQMDMLRAKEVVANAESFNEDKVVHFIDNMNIGSIRDFYPKTAEMANEIQRRSVENTRLGIPLIFIEEALHGYGGYGATNFPIPLGNASSWDTTMMHKIGKVIGSEGRAHGVHFVLSPNLDLVRDIRWGRVEETYGEDPYLSARMGVNIIKGMQGDTLASDCAVASEPKHYAIHGVPENGHNAAPVHIGEREARMEPLYVFEKAIKEANARGVMAAYHDIDGVPCVANHWLLTEVLRDDWGFTGFVVSDLDAIALQLDFHMTASTEKEAVTNSVNAGLNMQFYDFPYDVFQQAVIDAVNDGSISMETIDSRVSDILRVKFELGLFDNPYTDPSLIAKRLASKEHKELALEASRKSITLLKNDNNTLPFSKDIKRVTLVGNLANVSSIGGYCPAGSVGVTVYEALKARFGAGVEIDMITNSLSKNFANLPMEMLSEAIDSKEPGLRADFFNNDDLEGKPVYTMLDNAAPYWHNLSPAPGVNDDNFSVRWSGYLDVPFDGEYEFMLNANDRGRLYLNGEMFIDSWDYSKSGKVTRKAVTLKAGKMPICIEYNEKDDVADIKCQWRLLEMQSVDEYLASITESASRSDVVIVAMGETKDEVGEARDKSNLDIPQDDLDIVKAAVEGGKPTAVVLLNGRPLILTELEKISPATLEAWFPGQDGGTAVCDVLFGDYNPSGHLTISFPKDQNMMPSFYSRKKSSRRKYVDGDGKDILYSFGHGLSYTTFDYSNLVVTPEGGSVDGEYQVSLDVTNSGKVAGSDAVQLYVSDPVASVTLPAIALKGFSYVHLEPGETKRVTMTLAPEHFAIYNVDMDRVVEPGEFIISIGHSSSDIVLKKSITLK